MAGKEEEMSPGGDEFPNGINLKWKLRRFPLIGPGAPRRDLPGPPAQNSPKSMWRKENKFHPNCHFGYRPNKTTPERTEQESIPEIS